MKKLLMVGLVMMVGSTALAVVDTYSINGITYAELKSFAAEIGAGYSARVGSTQYWDLSYKGKILSLVADSAIAEYDGKKYQLPGTVTASGDSGYAPLDTLRGLFQVNVKTQAATGTAPTPQVASPATTGSSSTTSNSASAREPEVKKYTLNQLSINGDDTFLKKYATKYSQKYVLSTEQFFNVCRNLTRDSLKSPASAQFDSDELPDVTKYSDGYYAISGKLDAQNGYGALIRNSYTCWMKQYGPELYIYHFLD